MVNFWCSQVCTISTILMSEDDALIITQRFTWTTLKSYFDLSFFDPEGWNVVLFGRKYIQYYFKVSWKTTWVYLYIKPVRGPHVYTLLAPVSKFKQQSSVSGALDTSS